MNKKRINRGTFWIVLVLIACITYVSIFGLNVWKINIPSADQMRFGIDIRGGVEAVYFPKDYDPTVEELNAAKASIEKRCDDKNISDREVTINEERKSILLRFPWKSDETDFNPEEAIKELGSTYRLTFRDPNGNVLLEGKNVKKATPETANNSTGLSAGGFVVDLEFDSEGADLFYNATSSLVGSNMGIYMDENPISMPKVNEAISGGRAQITGIATMEEAVVLANRINAGALPFALESSNYNAISPSMGSGALDVMVDAGILAFILICLFMLFYYRLPGLVAIFALTLQVAGQLLALSIPQYTLTLPGIAAVILSIGMGVDANIITAERIKEEIADGKPVRSAIDAGYHKAFSAVFDGNITVIIVAVILMIFGSGTMISFGYSLLTGAILNFVCGVTTSKLMTKSLGQYGVFRKTWMYGSGKKRTKVVNFFKKKAIFYIISLAIMVVGVVGYFVNGIDLDIQFKGGAMLNYSYTGDVDTEQVKNIAEEALNREIDDVSTKKDYRSGTTRFVINLAGEKGISAEEQEQLTTAMQAKFADNNIKQEDVNVVEPFIGRDFLSQSIMAVVIAVVLIILYVWYSFRKISGLTAGLAGILALVHDVIVVLITFIVFGIAINDSFIAAALTILGFSINDTIVIFDRIRENKMLSGGKMPVEELVNKSVTQSISRSVNTSLCTLVSIVIVYIFAHLQGVESIKSFALPMIFGIISGCYSSVCLAGPIWTSWQKMARKRKEVKAAQ